jgi:Na+-transporting NADH:ubiquinone oxidoreductase subunit NqrC
MNPISFIAAHPVVILYLAAGWFVAAVISCMPPLPEGKGFFTRWAYSVAQVVGASLDKVSHAALQTTYARQVEQSLADGSTTKSVETTATTVNPTNQGATQ